MLIINIGKNGKKMDGIIGALAGFGQGLLQRQTDKLNANRNFQQNMEMSKYQYSKDLEMWNRANEYNAPASQMARYQSAGLNPNLIYGSGTASAGNTATTLPKYQAPTYQQNYHPPVDLATVLGMYQDFRLKQAQIDNLKTQGRILSADAIIHDIDSGYYVNDPYSDIGSVGKNKARLAKSQADVADYEGQVRKKMLASKLNNIEIQNEYGQKRNDWFVANQLSSIITKVLGGIGFSQIGKRLAPAPRFYKK